MLTNSRLMQNRKSAKKCRLKKKAEFGSLKSDVDKISHENSELKMKVSAPPLTRQINEITVMLYQKIEENNALQRRIEQQAQSQN